jgi:hypothetical protein
MRTIMTEAPQLALASFLIQKFGRRGMLRSGAPTALKRRIMEGDGDKFE